MNCLVYIYMYIYTCMYVYIYMDSYMYIYSYMYIHVHVYRFNGLFSILYNAYTCVHTCRTESCSRKTVSDKFEGKEIIHVPGKV